jgi:hypothetical protein
VNAERGMDRNIQGTNKQRDAQRVDARATAPLKLVSGSGRSWSCSVLVVAVIAVGHSALAKTNTALDFG